MGDLAVDTAVTPLGDGRYRATLRAEWEIWGPMGGYVAAVALRAAGADSPFLRPASFTAHYLGVARFDEVEVVVETRRQARTATAQRVSMTQGDRPVLDAMVWSIGPVEGLAHHLAEPPDVDGPEGLPSMEELRGGDAPTFAFWHNLQTRPVGHSGQWPPPGPLPPAWQTWQSFVPTATFDDPWVDAARSVILLDVAGWPSLSRHHAWRDHGFTGPSLDLYVAFHEPAPQAAWLLADGCAPVAGDGLYGWHARIWSPARRLVASGQGQGLFRTVPSGPPG